MGPEQFVQTVAASAGVLAVAALVLSARTLHVVAGWLAATRTVTNGRRVAAWAAWWRLLAMVAISALVVVGSVVTVASAADCAEPWAAQLRAVLLAAVGAASLLGALADAWERGAIADREDDGGH